MLVGNDGEWQYHSTRCGRRSKGCNTWAEIWLTGWKPEGAMKLPDTKILVVEKFTLFAILPAGSVRTRAVRS